MQSICSLYRTLWLAAWFYRSICRMFRGMIRQGKWGWNNWFIDATAPHLPTYFLLEINQSLQLVTDIIYN